MSDESTTTSTAWPQGHRDLLGIPERRQAFGQKLRAAREAKHATIISLAQATRISSNFIEALESGQFERLPGEVFGRGFLRNLSRALGLPAEDATVLLEDYNDCSSDEEAQVPKKAKSRQSIALPQSQTTATTRKLSPQVSATVDSKRHSSTSHLRYSDSVKRLNSKWVWAAAAVLVATVGTGAFYKMRGFKLGESVSWKSPQPAAVVEPITAKKPEPVVEDVGLETAENAELAAPPVTAPNVEPLQVETTKSGESDETAAKAPVPVEVKPVQTVISAPSGATSDVQTLEFIVTEPVKIRLGLDQQAAVVKEFKPDTYKFTFTKTAELLVFDAAAVKITYNGKSLGSLGSKGRVRRISFDAVPPAGEKF